MKKGFTLIELLSVIVILAVITLIAVPVISGIITKVRLNALKSSAYGLMEASNIYHAQYENKKSVRFDINKNKVSSNDTDMLLTYNGEVKEGTVIINKKGETSLCITDGKNSVYKNYNDKDVIAVANKKCTIPSSTYVVYLDNQATLNELSNQELTELVQSMQERMTRLEENLETTSTVAGNAATLDKIYPVGSIYITTTEDTVAKVQNKFGGTWVSFGTGKTLVGVNGNDSSFNTVEKEGGNKTHTLDITEIPYHRHSIPTLSGTSDAQGKGYWFYGAPNVFQYSDVSGASVTTVSTGGSISAGHGSNTISTYHSHTVTTYASNTGYTGGYNAVTQSFSLLQPYVTVYMYKRTA